MQKTGSHFSARCAIEAAALNQAQHSQGTQSMAENKPGFLSRLFGRKADTPTAPEPAPATPQAGGEPEAMPSPPTTGADDLAAAQIGRAHV